MNSKKIGAFIAEKRMVANMTQEELAGKLYVSNKTISKWECGKGIPSVEMLEPLSKILNVSIMEILIGEDAINDTEILIKKLKLKRKKRIINLILGIVVCLFLCTLEAILYLSGINGKYAYIILGIFIICWTIIDIANYFLHK